MHAVTVLLVVEMRHMVKNSESHGDLSVLLVSKEKIPVKRIFSSETITEGTRRSRNVITGST